MIADKGIAGISGLHGVGPSLMTAVLDTNIALDCLVFDDLAVRPLSAAIQAGRLRWIGSSAMVQELNSVLSRPGFDRWRAKFGSVPALVQRHCALELAPTTAPVPALHCSDNDDQKFIDFAVAQQASWLFTRDKALLRLARRARRYGVAILRPADWRG